MLILQADGPPPQPFALSISDPISQTKQVSNKRNQGGGSDKKKHTRIQVKKSENEERPYIMGSFP